LINILWNFAVYRSKISYVLTQNTSDRRVGAVWPVDRWCRYQPVASSSKRMCLCTWRHTWA